MTGAAPTAADLPTLEAPLGEGVTGLFTTRAGGVSAGPWTTFNLAGHVGDEPERVAANRARLAERLAAADVVFLDQRHGVDVATVDRFEPVVHSADAAVTAAKDVAVAVLVADCVPVLLADAAAGVVAAAHAGRLGLAAGILPTTLAAMARLGAAPTTTVAVVGPAICGGCYEVPEEMRDAVAAVVPGSAATTRAGTPSLDLAAGAEAVLAAAGVATVRRMAACTLEDARFYSYRRDRRTGRFAGVVRRDP